MKIAVVLKPVKEGGFAVVFPSVPGCFSHGKTKKEALKNARAAIKLHLKVTKNDLKGLRRGCFLENITV